MNEVSLALQTHHDNGTYRLLKRQENLIDFSSNDYLGLSNCSIIRSKIIKSLADGCPLGGTSSRLLCGQSQYHEQVEDFLAKTFAVESALLFSSGYLANLAVNFVFGSLNAEFFSDELNHASIIDGIKISGAKKSIFRHNNLSHLKELLTSSSSPMKVIVTESVFSMDGDLSPLSELIDVAQRYNAWLVVDEAHATGVFGSKGLGRLEYFSFDRLVAIHTGGKALGAQGAFVLCPSEFRNLIVNRARSFIYTTALTPLAALQIQFALENILDHPQRGKKLLDMALSWKKSLPYNFQTLQSQSQIIPIVLGSNERALKTANKLQKRGFDVRAIRSPTVPIGTERLRVSFKSFHSEQDLMSLSLNLAELVL